MKNHQWKLSIDSTHTAQKVSGASLRGLLDNSGSPYEINGLSFSYWDEVFVTQE